jgi:hypothetical protein
MQDWKLHPFVFSSTGKNDQIAYNNEILYAPDCIEKNNQYYLYYCQPGAQAEGVAVGNTPTSFGLGKKINTNGIEEIDPSAFVDDDGKAYYVWGQFSLKIARLKADMMHIDTNTIQKDVITEKDHYFHEGAYLTKRNKLYYLVYAHEGRQNKPSCLGYATASKVTGPYTYRGVIIDNSGCNPGNWNNHGSIASFQNQWYVFYHRSTNGVAGMRKACVEKIFFDNNGLIKEVEMTSQGAGAPLRATDTIEARRACIIDGSARVLLNQNQEILGAIKPNDRLAYKYIDFGKGADSIYVKVKLPKVNGGFNMYLDKPWGAYLGYFHLEGDSNSKDWVVLAAKINKTKGVHALWIQFYGGSQPSPEVEIDSFWFR